MLKTHEHLCIRGKIFDGYILSCAPYSCTGSETLLRSEEILVVFLVLQHWAWAQIPTNHSIVLTAISINPAWSWKVVQLRSQRIANSGIMLLHFVEGLDRIDLCMTTFVEKNMRVSYGEGSLQYHLAVSASQTAARQRKSYYDLRRLAAVWAALSACWPMRCRFWHHPPQNPATCCGTVL